jgi:hypothetical protein
MRETVSTHVDASPTAVFERVTDITRLPEWNRAIPEVLEQPRQMVPGSVWKVRLHALGQSWVSTSTLVELDETERRFRHRSQTDDGNPSYADWEWNVTADGTGSIVTVAVELHPLTFWRKYLLVHLRRPALRREMKTSLVALCALMTATSGGSG